jgi:hypothetical protein
VRQLHTGDAALRVDEANDAREHVDVFVAPDAEIVRADAAFWQDRRRFGQHEPGAADRTAAEVDEVPVGREPIAARVLAHRRYEHAVVKGHATD